MRTATTHRNMARCAATATLACVLGLGLSVAPAYGDTSSDLAAAREKLEQIGTQTQKIYEDLSAQTKDLDQTAGEITKKQQEVSDGQAKLSSYVSGNYKSGGMSLLTAFTGVDNLSDMVNNLFYYNKVSDKQAKTIEDVKKAQTQLSNKQAEQQKNIEATQKKVDELNAQQAEAQNVVNSLDSQLQQELAAEAEQNAALQAGINASTAEKATVTDTGSNDNSNNGGSSNNGGTADNSNNGGGQTNNGGGNAGGGNQTTPSNPTPATPAQPSTPSQPSSSVDSGSVVGRAYSKLGCDYSWGACGPNQFDCSGFVSYCLTGRYCRLGTTYTFMGWQRVSDPQPGDVVTNSYHCGIYIGNGQMIHASDYGIGVIVSSVSAGMNGNYIFVRY